MNATAADQLVARYLARLQAALRDLPAARREELLEQQVSEHIATARAELGAQASEAKIRTLLERLGDPAAIAAEAGHGSDQPVEPPRARPGWLEVAALVLLPIGGIVVPVLGWFVGVALLWTSQRWSVRDKLLGTLVVPGGLALPLALGLFTTSLESCVTSPVPASGGHPNAGLHRRPARMAASARPGGVGAAAPGPHRDRHLPRRAAAAPAQRCRLTAIAEIRPGRSPPTTASAETILSADLGTSPQPCLYPSAQETAVLQAEFVLLRSSQDVRHATRP